MTEEFDAWHWSNFSGSILILALLILPGLILEYGIHRLDKLAEAEDGPTAFNQSRRYRYFITPTQRLHKWRH